MAPSYIWVRIQDVLVRNITHVTVYLGRYVLEESSLSWPQSVSLDYYFLIIRIFVPS